MCHTCRHNEKYGASLITSISVYANDCLKHQTNSFVNTNINTSGSCGYCDLKDLLIFFELQNNVAKLVMS